MQQKVLKYIPVFLIVITALLFANLQINKRSGANSFCWNISGDGRGYYAWLPALFIYHDLNFNFTDTVEKKVGDCSLSNGMPIQEYRYGFGDKKCDKYYPGTAVLMLPFFGIAHYYTLLFTKYPADGYSMYYFKIIGIAAPFYYLIGMLFLLGIIRMLRLNYAQQIASVLLLIFGSNILYYTIDTPAWSHIYSFATVSALIWCLMRVKSDLTRHLNAKNLMIISMLLGLIFILRPVNIILILFIPFYYWDVRLQISDYFLRKPTRLFYLLPGALWLIALFSIYKMSTGNYLLYSYKDEKFDFLHPHTWQFLFHYNNGIFPYTPLLLIPFVFIINWYRKEDELLIAGIVVTLATAIYVNSSWWWWSFGLSFGSRPMLDYLPLFGIIISLSIKNLSKKLYIPVATLYILCSSLTMILYNAKSSKGYMHQLSAEITDYWPAVFDALGIK